MTRRTFVIAAVAATGGMVGLWSGLPDRKSVVVAMVQKKLGYLRLEAAAVNAFAEDFVRHDHSYVREMRILAAILPVYRRSSLAAVLRVQPELVRLEEAIVTQFLLLSDFFWNLSNESLPVRYVRYYDPHAARLLNPLRAGQPL